MQFYQKLLELIIPANYVLTSADLQKDYTPFIKSSSTNSLQLIWVATEYTSDIKDIINRAKTKGCYDLIDPLVENLIIQIANDTPCKNPNNQEILTLQDIWPTTISFVPPDPVRYRLRGYHLPIIIAKKVAKALKSSYIPLVKKHEGTQSQSELNRSVRLTNLENKFQSIEENMSIPKLITDPIIWLIDDISTTGSTLIEVANTIKKQLPNCTIYGIVLSGGADD